REYFACSPVSLGLAPGSYSTKEAPRHLHFPSSGYASRQSAIQRKNHHQRVQRYVLRRDPQLPYESRLRPPRPRQLAEDRRAPGGDDRPDHGGGLPDRRRERPPLRRDLRAP